MIYDIKTRTIIATPPKCGTTILHHVMCGFPNYWYILGPAKWDTTSKHCSISNIHTTEIKIERTVLLMRNPIDRMISMWKHRRSYDKYEESLSGFIRNNNLSSGWYAPCTTYCEKVDAVLHQETLFEDCKKELGIQLDELLELRMNNSQFKYEPTQEEKELLKQATHAIYHEDLRVGQYEV